MPRVGGDAQRGRSSRRPRRAATPWSSVRGGLRVTSPTGDDVTTRRPGRWPSAPRRCSRAGRRSSPAGRSTSRSRWCGSSIPGTSSSPYRPGSAVKSPPASAMSEQAPSASWYACVLAFGEHVSVAVKTCSETSGALQDRCRVPCGLLVRAAEAAVRPPMPSSAAASNSPAGQRITAEMAERVLRRSIRERESASQAEARTSFAKTSCSKRTSPRMRTVLPSKLTT